MSLKIIKKYNIFAKKSLGQNFLIDENILEEISLCTEIKDKNILEVWPWYGALTKKILEKKPKKLTLVELDNSMVEILKDREKLWDFNTEWVDFSIKNRDVLKFELESKKYSVIANIPYYITSPILRHFLYDVKNIPEEMIILMQKDVWDKILWKWKNKSSVLSLFIEKKCRVSEKIFVPKESFFPIPKIESSVLSFKIHNDFLEIDDRKFLEVIKKWFLAPRKKLIKNLVQWGYKKEKILDFFKKNNIWESIRGEDLTIDIWCRLVSTL